MDSIGKIFDIHPLILEDTLNNEHLPKIEETPNSLYLTLKHITFSESNVDIDTTHLSFILSNNFLITFSETNCDLYNNIRENIQSNKGKIRKNKTDYLFYVLLDAIVDNYYIVFEALIDRIDELEDKLIENKTENLIKEIHQLKKALSSTRKLVYPLTEALNKLIIEQSDFIHDHTQIYIKDVYDHILQLTEIYETCREMLAGLIDLNLSNINNNMNNVMKTLTIISFIFIPLTFIVGLYGMNFKYMPELEYKYSYPILLLFMLTLVLFTIFYIKKKKWF
jgi:magnesium transporter